jgi:hypothetical protein
MAPGGIGPPGPFIPADLFVLRRPDGPSRRVEHDGRGAVRMESVEAEFEPIAAGVACSTFRLPDQPSFVLAR